MLVGGFGNAQVMFHEVHLQKKTKVKTKNKQKYVREVHDGLLSRVRGG